MALRSGLKFYSFIGGMKTEGPSTVHILVGLFDKVQNIFSLKNRFFLKILIRFLSTTAKNILSI